MKVLLGNVVKGLKANTFQQPKVKAKALEAAKDPLPAPPEDALADSLENSGEDLCGATSGSSSPHSNDAPFELPEKRTRRKCPASAAKPAGQARGRGQAGAAASKAAVVNIKPDVERVQSPEQEASEPLSVPESPNADEQPPAVQQPVAEPAAAGRASKPASQRNSLSQGAARTGEDIWRLNMALGKMVEQLGDPEDAKQGKRRYKSPTLREKLHKQWGGTYGEKLEKELPAMDVDELPAPKYEPPLFLEETNDTDNEDDQRREVKPQPREVIDIDMVDATATVVATTAPTKKSGIPGGSKTGIKRPTQQGAAKKAAAAAGAVADRSETHAEDLTDRATAPSVAAQQEQEPPQAQGPQRRGTRKAKAVEAEAPATAPKSTLPKQPVPRRGTRAVAAAAAAAEDAAAVDPMDTQAAPPPSARGRRTQPASINGAAGKPPMPPASVSKPNEGAGGGADCTGGNATKRSREPVPVGDDTARNNKALRLEYQQQLKEIEGLRARNQELDLRCKDRDATISQLQAEVKNAKSAAAQVEKERGRDANELNGLQRDKEKLQAQVEERDEKINGLKEEVKQAKDRQAKFAKQAEGMLQEWKAEDAKTQARRNQQIEELLKSWQRG